MTRPFSVRARIGALLVLGVACFATSSSAASAIVVTNVWSRPAIDTGVVYLTATNRGVHTDRLIGASSPIARAAELHESFEMKASGSEMNMATGKIAAMHRVRFVAIPARGSATLRPGGAHVMLIGLHRELRVGAAFPLRLHFAHAGWITTIVHVHPF